MVLSDDLLFYQTSFHFFEAGADIMARDHV